MIPIDDWKPLNADIKLLKRCKKAIRQVVATGADSSRPIACPILPEEFVVVFLQAEDTSL